MLEYVAVFIIVGVAGYYTIRKLIREATGSECGDCSCSCDSSSTIQRINEIAEGAVQKRDDA